MYSVKIVATFYKVQCKHIKPGVVGYVEVFFQLPLDYVSGKKNREIG